MCLSLCFLYPPAAPYALADLPPTDVNTCLQLSRFYVPTSFMPLWTHPARTKARWTARNPFKHGKSDGSHLQQVRLCVLSYAGHLVDEVTSTFTCAKATQIALLYILNISTWHVQMCIPQSRSPFASSPFLLVTPPSKNVLYIVDLNFNEKFQAARQSRRLKGLLKSLPKAFVGTHSNLAKCLSWCSSIVQVRAW